MATQPQQGRQEEGSPGTDSHMAEQFNERYKYGDYSDPKVEPRPAPEHSLDEE